RVFEPSSSASEGEIVVGHAQSAELDGHVERDVAVEADALGDLDQIRAHQVFVDELRVDRVAAVTERQRERGASSVGTGGRLQVSTINAMLPAVEADASLGIDVAALEQGHRGHQLEDAGRGHMSFVEQALA